MNKFIFGRTEHREWGLLLLRAGAGILMFFNHGLSKILGGPEKWNALGMSGMSTLGIDFGYTFFGFMAAISESIGAILIVFGLFTRPSSMLLFLTMAVGTMYHVLSGKGSPEKAILFGLIFLVLYWIGPGKVSLDHYLFNKEK